MQSVIVLVLCFLTITMTRNNINNTRINRKTITKKNKGIKTTVQIYQVTNK